MKSVTFPIILIFYKSYFLKYKIGDITNLIIFLANSTICANKVSNVSN